MSIRGPDDEVSSDAVEDDHSIVAEGEGPYATRQDWVEEFERTGSVND